MRPSNDQIASMASQSNVSSTGGLYCDLREGFEKSEELCDTASQSLVKHGNCSSEIGDIKSKLEELKVWLRKTLRCSAPSRLMQPSHGNIAGEWVDLGIDVQFNSDRSNLESLFCSHSQNGGRTCESVLSLRVKSIPPM